MQALLIRGRRRQPLTARRRLLSVLSHYFLLHFIRTLVGQGMGKVLVVLHRQRVAFWTKRRV